MHSEEKRMYQVGEYVLYGIHGVCKITGTQQRVIDRKAREYLVLEPVAKNDTLFFFPTDNPTAMGKLKPLLSEKDIRNLLTSDTVRSDCWIPEENLRKLRYRNLVASCDRTELLQMVGSLYRHQETQSASGKKIHQCDENFLKDAEKILTSEICFVLQIPESGAKDYLRKTMMK